MKAYRENREKERISEVREASSPQQEPVQSEMGLNEPPENNDESLAETKQPTSLPGIEQINALWLEYAAEQVPRITNLMKLFEIQLEGTEIFVTIGSKAQRDLMEEIRMPFWRFLREKCGTGISAFRIEQGEVKETERRPYTEKEKLVFMLKKHPEWQEMIDKLHLRLP
jgi:hypothetical protein